MLKYVLPVNKRSRDHGMDWKNNSSRSRFTEYPSFERIYTNWQQGTIEKIQSYIIQTNSIITWLAQKVS